MVVGFHLGKRRARGKARRVTLKPWRDEIFGALAGRERSNTLTDKVFGHCNLSRRVFVEHAYGQSLWKLQLESPRIWLNTLTDKVFGHCNLSRRVFG